MDRFADRGGFQWCYQGAVDALAPVAGGEKRVRRQPHLEHHAYSHFLLGWHLSVPDQLQSYDPTCIYMHVQVLGHHMSKLTSALYSKAQSAAEWDVRLIPSIDDGDERHHAKARAKLEENIEQYLSR